MRYRFTSTSPLIAFGVTLVAYATALGSVHAQDMHLGHDHALNAPVGNTIPSPVPMTDTLASSVVQGDIGNYVGDLPQASSSGTYVGDSSAGETIDLGTVGGGGTMAGCRGRGYGQPDLFYNYFTQGYCNSANAQMYLSPLPIPPNVGHTFFTYQPFYPHEMLYSHTDTFHRYYDNGRGYNRTKARYSSSMFSQLVSNMYWNYFRRSR